MFMPKLAQAERARQRAHLCLDPGMATRFTSNLGKPRAEVSKKKEKKPRAEVAVLI